MCNRSQRDLRKLRTRNADYITHRRVYQMARNRCWIWLAHWESALEVETVLQLAQCDGVVKGAFRTCHIHQRLDKRVRKKQERGRHCALKSSHPLPRTPRRPTNSPRPRARKERLIQAKPAQIDQKRTARSTHQPILMRRLDRRYFIIGVVHQKQMWRKGEGSCLAVAGIAVKYFRYWD